MREGKGGIQALGDEDLDNIHQTIDDEVLMRREITFRSTSAEPAGDGGVIHVGGDLSLFGNSHPVTFDLRISGAGAVAATAVVRQSNWGMKPYSALFGALKVADDVEVEVEGHLQAPAS